MFTYDVIVLGSGPGGYVAAIRAAQNGLRTIIVERDRAGGVCSNWGCIPTKSLIEAATLMRSIPELERYGVKADRSAFSYSRVQEESRSASEKLSRGVRHLLKSNGVEIVEDSGYIAGPHHVRLVASGRVLDGASIIIATGSREREIPLVHFDGRTIIASKDALALRELPKDLVILGAGAIGVEFSYIFNAFGVSVTLVELLDRVLPSEDEEISALLSHSLSKQGVKVLTATRATSCVPEGNRATLGLVHDGAESIVSAEKVLISVGRRPNSEDIGLEGMGVRTSRGFISTGDYYETTITGIYAIGDVIGQPMLAHAASSQGMLVADYLAGKNTERRIQDTLVPKAVYCEPQVASFGITETEAKNNGMNVNVSKFPFRGCGKAVAVGKPDGFVKIVADSSTREIVGASIIGMQATEIIHELLLAKSSELVPEDIMRMVHAHPTFSEAVLEASRGLFDKPLHI
jgi:dihydrolipoamide dehydrogenase